MNSHNPSKNYFIVRYFRDIRKRPIIKQRGLSLSEAMRWCERDDTHKEGVWFEGFTDDPPIRAR